MVAVVAVAVRKEVNKQGKGGKLSNEANNVHSAKINK